MTRNLVAHTLSWATVVVLLMSGGRAIAQDAASPARVFPDPGHYDDPDKPYRIDWQRGNLAQIVCDNGAYFTIRYSESRKRFFVQELVDVSDTDFDKTAGVACQF